jgi:hypothetical protein
LLELSCSPPLARTSATLKSGPQSLPVSEKVRRFSLDLVLESNRQEEHL